MKRVQQLHKPFTFRRRQDVSLGQDVSDLVKFEEQLFAHDLQGTDLPGVLLLRQVYLAIATLTDLGQDLEVALSKSRPSLAEVRALPTQPLRFRSIIVGARPRIWIALVELLGPRFALAHVIEKVKVMIEKV